MKSLILALLFFGAVQAFSAEGLKIGDDAKEFSLKNIDGSIIPVIMDLSLFLLVIIAHSQRHMKIASLLYIKIMPAKVSLFWQSIRMIL